jgi:hypothetical protein
MIMLRKIVVTLVCLLSVSSGLVAKENKNALIFDFAPTAKGIIASDSDAKTGIFGLGVSYEHLVKKVSIGFRMDLYAGTVSDVSAVYFALSGNVRYYPFAAKSRPTLEKLFLETDIGFNTESLDGESTISGLTFSGRVGYKVIGGKHFCFEPSIAYVYAKTGVIPCPPIGWQLGLGIGGVF